MLWFIVTEVCLLIHTRRHIYLKHSLRLVKCFLARDVTEVLNSDLSLISFVYLMQAALRSIIVLSLMLPVSGIKGN